ncbi:MAG: hypothetical protein KBC02_03655 [Candidatus Pacebacteria bacterium]|nr:hypothetical protein [Candidatus Paceibacterota bacterium]
MKHVIVHDRMQKGYRYELVAREGRDFDERFTPDLTPQEMLRLGVFGGRYLRDCRDEFPARWFTRAKLLPDGVPGHDPHLNFFGVDASQSLAEWKRKGWIYPEDPRGWFQWYCRYYLGRRIADDEVQIQRWRSIRRHIAQIKKHCRAGDALCRPRQRQALLHWAYDSRSI